MKKLALESLKILFAAGLIYWLLRSGRLSFDGLDELINIQFLPLGFILLCGNIFFASERWRLLVSIQNLNAKPLGTLRLTLIGLFFNFAMPGGVGGDVVKAWYFHKDFPDSRVVAVSSVMIDRILGLYAMILLALSTMLFDLSYIFSIPVLKALFVVVSLVWLGFSLALVILFWPRLRESRRFEKLFTLIPLGAKLHKLYHSLHFYGSNKKLLVAGICLSLLSQFCAIGFLWLVANILNHNPIEFHTIAFVAPLGFITTALPISPAGIGVGQTAFYYLFNLYTNTTSSLGSVSITAFQIGQFCLALIGALLYVMKRQKNESLENLNNLG
ncbi:MAG: lysylphosphatidylglycerol synthase transmembrane domain-containing protein [Bdellovibrionia bacterium]